MSSLQDSITYKGKRVVFKNMALYALGDMHLSFMAHKSMDKFGKVWKNHEEKIEQNCNRIIQSGDTFVITGDHSWGRKLADAKPDLEFIANLPGEKILLRGNHDMFWNAKKTALLNEQYEPRLHFLQNNYYCDHDYALVGTKGYTFEGPFLINAKGQIISCRMIWKSSCRLLRIFRNGLNELLANYQTLDLPCRSERAGTGAFVPDC